MSRGHGAPGLVDNLRTFLDLIDDATASRRPFLDFLPGVSITPTAWSVNSGAAYYYNGYIQYLFNGVPLDIDGVDTSLGALTRVESLADCIAGAGTFYATPNVGNTAETSRWDDGVTLFDAAGATWDHVATIDLYVHLPGDANPTAAAVVPLLRMAFAARGEVHPQLGPEKLTNGGFELLTGWSLSPAWDDGATQFDQAGAAWDGAGAFAALQDSTLFYGRGSTKSLKLVSSGAATGSASAWQDKATVVGAMYLFAAYYRTDPAFSGNLSARLVFGNTAGTALLYADGRDSDANGFAALTPTNGEWRRCFFTFIAPASTTRLRLQLRAPASPGAGQVNFDGGTCKRIYRFAYYEPRLAGGNSLPPVEIASQSIFFGGKTTSLGRVGLLNADGALDTLLAQLITTNRPATTYVGGTLSDGQEVYRDDWRAGFGGISQQGTADDQAWSFDLEDARRFSSVLIAPNKVTRVASPNASAQDDNQARWVVFNSDSRQAFGTSAYYRPRRVDKTANGYGVYELADCSFWPTGLEKITTPGAYVPIIASFPNESLADKLSVGDGLYPSLADGGFAWYTSVLPSGQYSYDPTTGLLTVLDDLRNYYRDRQGNYLTDQDTFDFNIGGATLTARPTASAFSLGGAFAYASATMLAAGLQDQMRVASGAGDIFVTYDHATHLFTVRKTAGALNLLPSSGTNKSLLGWGMIGINRNVDKTGALTYTSDVPTFTDVDNDHIIRLTAHGYKDNAAGDVTGTPGLVIDRHAWVAKFILYAILGVPLSQIESSEFSAGAAAEGGRTIRALIGEQLSVGDVLARLELGALADLVVDGDGRWRWRPYSAAAAAAQSFFDRDFLSFRMWRDPLNVFKAVNLTYAVQPYANTQRLSTATADTAAPTKYGRREDLNVDTWLEDTGSLALTLAQRLARLSVANPLMVEFSSRSKLADLLIGDKIALTRSRAPTSTGSLAAALYRIVKLKHDFLSGVSTCVAVEDVQFLS